MLRLTASGGRANIRRAGTVESTVAEALAATDVADLHGAEQVLGRLAVLLDGVAVVASSIRPGAARGASGGHDMDATTHDRVASVSRSAVAAHGNALADLAHGSLTRRAAVPAR